MGNNHGYINSAEPNGFFGETFGGLHGNGQEAQPTATIHGDSSYNIATFNFSMMYPSWLHEVPWAYINFRFVSTGVPDPFVYFCIDGGSSCQKLWLAVEATSTTIFSVTMKKKFIPTAGVAWGWPGETHVSCV